MSDGKTKVARGPGRPQKYRLKDGTVVPGVTTICNRFKDAGGLIHWAWSQGMDGFDYRRTRDDAGDAGSLAHAMIEAHIHGERWDSSKDDRYDPEVLKRAKNAFANFLAWSEQTKLRLIATELPLVSEVHRFGGTLDAIGEVLGELCLVDWKSSAGVYADYLAQVAAYVTLYEERYPGARLETVHLLRVDKEYAGFHHHRWGRSVIDDAWKYFLLARQMYDLDRQLKKAAA
jgi:hypothetical protein